MDPRKRPATAADDASSNVIVDLTTAREGNEHSSTALPPPAKRARRSDKSNTAASNRTSAPPTTNATATNTTANNNNNNTTSSSQQPSSSSPQQHLHRLSKWASRLFDPNRPRGVIEPPQVIPLNDEFLQNFGQREKAYDKALGKQALDIDNAFLAEDNDEDDSKANDDSDVEEQDNEDTATDRKPSKKRKRKPKSKKEAQGFQVKVNNLKYTTTEERLQKACGNIGDVLKVVLMMDEDNASLNRGWALVTFADEAAAQQCIASSMTLDGRPLRFEKGLDKKSNAGAGARYFLGDGSTANNRQKADLLAMKCFRCGNAGHAQADCTLPPKPKPCPLCADTETHSEPRQCPLKAICFNCGIPGHVSRYCTQRRGMPPLSICTSCFATGHTKYQCYSSASAADLRHAVCMVCGRQGHFCCRPLSFQSGWNGLTCGNCGLSHHVLKQCRRPGLDALVRDEALALQEMEASAFSLSTSPPPSQQNRSSSRGGRPSSQQQQHGDAARHRAKSAPPPRNNRDFRRHHSMPEEHSTRYDAAPPPPPPPQPRYDSMPPRHERHNNEGQQEQQQRGRPRHREPPRRQHSENSSSFGGGGGRSRSGGGRYRGNGRR